MIRELCVKFAKVPGEERSDDKSLAPKYLLILMVASKVFCSVEYGR